LGEFQESPLTRLDGVDKAHEIFGNRLGTMLEEIDPAVDA
jgi:hypothetical protein